MKAIAYKGVEIRTYDPGEPVTEEPMIWHRRLHTTRCTIGSEPHGLIGAPDCAIALLKKSIDINQNQNQP